MASRLLSIASDLFRDPAETNNAVRAWVQQCEVLKTYQGMACLVIFEFGLRSNQRAAVAQLSEVWTYQKWVQAVPAV